MILRDGQEFDPGNFARVVDVNLNGTMRMCAAARELLFASRGCVINIASMLAFFGSGYAPAYSASKGGIAQLTKSLAIAWAPQGVRVNAIAPGWIETPLTAPLTSDAAMRTAISDRTPLGRWGKPADVAGAAQFLASPAAAFITGVILPVDGGYSIA
jgi:NAD(P)-dependent dehydrogenase (short-subunit alcohol dehydrogenase family)